MNSKEGKPCLDVVFSSGKHTILEYLNYFDLLQEYNSSNDVVFEYRTTDGVSKESALGTSTIYGGEIVETHNVTLEELDQISFGRG